MRVYVEPGFIDHFLSLPKDQNNAVKILWDIIKDYAEVTWLFNASVTFADFERWEISNTFYSSISTKGSNQVLLNRDFKSEILNNNHSSQLVLAESPEPWHSEIQNHAVVLTVQKFTSVIEKMTNDFSFKFIPDDNTHWNEFSSLKHSCVREITITDKYLIDKFLKTSDVRKLEPNFIYLLKKMLDKGDIVLNIFIKSADADFGKYEELYKKLETLVKYTRAKVGSQIRFRIVNAELDRNYNFHDRNIFSPYFIVKAGQGFTRDYTKKINTEVESYSLFDKWGYNLIRHRRRLCNDYLMEINAIPKAFTVYDS